MKDRWQKSLEAAVAAHDTPMPWARGDARKLMIARRKAQATADEQSQMVSARSA